MFDNPNKELQRLQDRLLAAEAPEEEPMEEPLQPEDELEALRAMLDQPVEEEEPVPERRQRGDRKSRVVGILAAMVLEILALGLVLIWWMLWRQ